jgi:hypothetical protein
MVRCPASCFGLDPAEPKRASSQRFHSIGTSERDGYSETKRLAVLRSITNSKRDACS